VTIASDRRAVNKARYRDAILDAARQLIAERGGPQFSVDELAERADVSRRTVFNHFVSVDEILLTLCTDLLAVLIDGIVAQLKAAPGTEIDLHALLGEIENAMRAPALVHAINEILTILGESDGPSSRADALKQIAFNRIAREMVDEIALHIGSADPLEIEILLGSVMAGMIVIADRWVAATAAAMDPPSLREWDRLVTLLFTRLRSGYGSAA